MYVGSSLSSPNSAVQQTSQFSRSSCRRLLSQKCSPNCAASTSNFHTTHLFLVNAIKVAFCIIGQSELRLTESKLQATEEELNSLSLDRLRASANAYRELFSKVSVLTSYPWYTYTLLILNNHEGVVYGH